MSPTTFEHYFICKCGRQGRAMTGVIYDCPCGRSMQYFATATEHRKLEWTRVKKIDKCECNLVAA